MKSGKKNIEGSSIGAGAVFYMSYLIGWVLKLTLRTLQNEMCLGTFGGTASSLERQYMKVLRTQSLKSDMRVIAV